MRMTSKWGRRSEQKLSYADGRVVSYGCLLNNMLPLTPAFSVTCMGDIFDMLCKRLKDHLTVKLAIFPVISRTNDKLMIITDLK